MIESRQKAYLEAMGIALWSARQTQPEQLASVPSPDVQVSANDEFASLKLGSGSGGILLVCALDTNSASKLSNDISRALGNVPVWGWPDSSDSSLKLSDAIVENLFTTVAIFGQQLAGQILGRDIPESLNSANLVILPAMEELERRQESRRDLWQIMCRSGMVIAA
jgi:DNA polymerase III psi subunit